MPSYLYSSTVNVTDARIKIRQYIGTTPQAKAYRVTGSWTSGSLTWNNKPGYTTTECSSLATLDNDNWYNFVVTTVIKKQLNGTYGDYGVMLKDNTESGTQHWATFYSSEAASPNKPELHITYTKNIKLRIIVGDSFASFYVVPTNKLEEDLPYMEAPFNSEWGIYFTKSLTEFHNMYIDYCSKWIGMACDHGDSCSNSTTTVYHHKNISKNLHQIMNGISTTGYDIFVAYVCGPLCRVRADNTHSNMVYGLTNSVGGKFAIVNQYPVPTAQYPNTHMVRVVQHEISHMFGCTDGQCTPGVPCIMSGGFDTTPLDWTTDIWCPACQARFDPNAQ